MKKIVIALMAAIATIGMISCASTSTMDDSAKKQAEINKSFDKVYTTYADALVLEGAEVYQVKKGDTLTSITKTFYAGKDENGYYFPLIMLASRNVVSDPELITPGMKLTIPNFDANINDKAVALKLKPYFKDLAEVYRQKATPAAEDIRPHLIEISEQLGKEEFPLEPEAAPAPAAN
ncbi:LysM peptidoglycan-binding domain-containing protein [uncultured Treponema sp.]|uniref:LysM peptidoglycan-binding domain-containing protein n=1 Tax=uncultured Treponema sp. TaxID=162155 RepID=UPI0025FBD9FC|nr:LysM peptidoglycan-binding domain-containing protein [uncultured Treponema sp.]